MLTTRHDNHHFSAQVASALESNPYVARRAVRFEAAAGRVTLHGKVRSFFHKQMAQESLRSVAGVDEITNLIEVGG